MDALRKVKELLIVDKKEISKLVNQILTQEFNNKSLIEVHIIQQEIDKFLFKLLLRKTPASASYSNHHILQREEDGFKEDILHNICLNQVAINSYSYHDYITPKCYLIHSIYHEISHLKDYQNSKATPMNLSAFQYCLFDFTVKENHKYYSRYHNEFIQEIIAEKYGAAKTLQFSDNDKNSNFSKNDIKYLLDVFSKSSQKEITYSNDFMISNLKQFFKYSFSKKKEELYYNYPIIQILFNENYKEKNIKELINIDLNKHMIKDEVKYSIICEKINSNPEVLEKNKSTLNSEEWQILNKSFFWEQEQLLLKRTQNNDLFQQKFEDQKRWLENDKIITSKLSKNALLLNYYQQYLKNNQKKIETSTDLQKKQGNNYDMNPISRT